MKAIERFVVVCSLLLVVAVVPGDRAGSAASVSFGPPGLDGAGFQNVVAVDPRGTGIVLAGGDVAGINRSTDWGQNWRSSNIGITGARLRRIAALAFAVSPGEGLRRGGIRRRGRCLLVSTDAGQTWELRSSEPRFSGGNNNEIPGLPNPHPRSTGNLLAFDDVNGFIYAATFDQGVMRSADGGRTWTNLGPVAQRCDHELELGLRQPSSRPLWTPGPGDRRIRKRVGPHMGPLRGPTMNKGPTASKAAADVQGRLRFSTRLLQPGLASSA